MSSSPYPQVELLSLDSALALGALVARSPMQRSMPPPSPISALSQSSSSAANPGGAAAVMAHRGGGHGHGNADGIIADDVGGASLRVGALPLPAPLTHTLTVGDDAALRLLRFARCVRRLREAVRAGACDSERWEVERLAASPALRVAPPALAPLALDGGPGGGGGLSEHHFESMQHGAPHHHHHHHGEPHHHNQLALGAHFSFVCWVTPKGVDGAMSTTPSLWQRSSAAELGGGPQGTNHRYGGGGSGSGGVTGGVTGGSLSSTLAHRPYGDVVVERALRGELDSQSRRQRGSKAALNAAMRASSLSSERDIGNGLPTTGGVGAAYLLPLAPEASGGAGGPAPTAAQQPAQQQRAPLGSRAFTLSAMLDGARMPESVPTILREVCP